VQVTYLAPPASPPPAAAAAALLPPAPLPLLLAAGAPLGLACMTCRGSTPPGDAGDLSRKAPGDQSVLVEPW
jgi:hypothetical protein